MQKGIDPMTPAEVDRELRIKYLEAELLSLAKAVADKTAGKIHAIKAWRSSTGLGLKDSKDAIEKIAAEADMAREIETKVQAHDRIDLLERRVAQIERKLQSTLGDILASAIR